MKYVFLLVFFYHVIQAQDILMSNNDHKIECIITHFDSLNVYFTFKKSGEIIETYLPLTSAKQVYSPGIEMLNNYFLTYPQWEAKCENVLEVLKYRQSQEKLREGRTEEYCEIVFIDASPLFITRHENIKVKMHVDYGLGGGEQVVKDYRTGKDLIVKTNMQGLNYMNSFGWEFVNAYAIHVVSGGSVYHYMMKRKIRR